MGRKLGDDALSFIEWDLTNPDDRDPATQQEWCEAHGVASLYPSRWRKSEAWLRARAARALTFDDGDNEVVIDLLAQGNIEQVVKAAHEAALAGDVSAMKTYLQYATAFETPDDENVRDMSDYELLQALESAAGTVRERLSDEP